MLSNSSRFDEHLPMLAALPRYLSETDFCNPSSKRDTAFQYAFGTKLPFFKWLEQRPARLRVVNSAMTIQRTGRSDGDHWFTYYPVESSIMDELPAADFNSVLLVDVGGGVGHDMIAFKQHFPTSTGRLVLQDLGHVVENVDNLPDGVEIMEHDFFTDQPITNARAYYLHTVLHDWPDTDCHQILRKLSMAMSSRSKLLINEIVLEETGTPLFPAQFDLSMMAMHGSMERTENQWRDLLEHAGLEIERIHKPKGSCSGVECLIEATRCADSDKSSS